ncbi:hypothetical protein [Cellvibrio sp. OA-2007]|uniref:hypothetical protein n=1 Tax=Cellvibrio sp. OA-2007 TaxID=529823 RepID=UPI0007858B36|nr:hypothetical protein [Cellvibrio sp. OA-2007]
MSKKTTVNAGAIQKIITAAKQNNLIVVVGAGLSKGLTNGRFPSWKELIDNGLTYGVIKGLISESQAERWREHIASTDIDDLLGVAEFLGRKLGAPSDVVYARWLQELFSNTEISNTELGDAVRILSSHDIPICTLNYDHLLESLTGLSSVHISDPYREYRTP